MIISRSGVIGALAIVTLGATTASAATFTTTSTLHEQYFWPNLSTEYDTSKDHVGLGTFSPTFNHFSPSSAFSLVISPNNITLSRRDGATTGLFFEAAFNGAKYSDLTNSIGAFLSVTINAATNVSGFDLSRLIFDQDNFLINLQDLSWAGGQKISLDFNAVAVPLSSVPLPATLPLFLTAIGALGVLGRWRRRRVVTTHLA